MLRLPDVLVCKDPERFLPERFIEGAEEHEEGVYKKWLPFGDGVRACIGARFALMVPKSSHSRFFHCRSCSRSPNGLFCPAKRATYQFADMYEAKFSFQGSGSTMS